MLYWPAIVPRKMLQWMDVSSASSYRNTIVTPLADYITLHHKSALSTCDWSSHWVFLWKVQYAASGCKLKADRPVCWSCNHSWSKPKCQNCTPCATRVHWLRLPLAPDQKQSFCNFQVPVLAIYLALARMCRRQSIAPPVHTVMLIETKHYGKCCRRMCLIDTVYRVCPIYECQMQPNLTSGQGSHIYNIEIMKLAPRLEGIIGIRT